MGSNNRLDTSGMPGSLLARGRLLFLVICLLGGAFPAPAQGAVPSQARNGRIAFVAPSPNAGTENLDIFTVDPRGREVTNLTDRGFAQSSPSWSPDGRSLAFATFGEIHVMAGDGRAERVAFSAAGGIAHSPSWSPDATKLALVVNDHDEGGALTGTRIVTTRVGARASRTLLTSEFGLQDPVWSPNGDRLAFFECGDQARALIKGSRCSAYTMQADGSDLRDLSAPPSHDSYPTWLDNERVILVSTRSCFEEAHRVSPTVCAGVYSVRWDGSGAEVVALPSDWTGDEELDYFWKIGRSPDGREFLVVLATGSKVYELWRWNPKTDERVRILPQITRPDVDWQPRCTLKGTSGDDLLRGTAGRDLVCGLGGDDTIYGLGGDDVIFGHGGDDRILGGPGRDIVVGNAGRNRCDRDEKDHSRVC